MVSDNNYKYGSIIKTDKGEYLQVVIEEDKTCTGCYLKRKSIGSCKIEGKLIPCLKENFILQVPSISEEDLELEEDHRVC